MKTLIDANGIEILEVIQGEKFNRKIGGINPDIYDQIKLVMTCKTNSTSRLEWVKVSETDGDTLIKESDDINMPILLYVDSTGLETGDYTLEAKCTLAGVDELVVKNKEKFLVIVASETD